jgi:hypothetical protein
LVQRAIIRPHRKQKLKTPYVLESGRSSCFYNSECRAYIKIYLRNTNSLTNFFETFSKVEVQEFR